MAASVRMLHGGWLLTWNSGFYMNTPRGVCTLTVQHMHHHRLRNLIAQHAGVVARVLTIGIGDIQATQSSSWQHVRLDTANDIKCMVINLRLLRPYTTNPT